MHLFIIKECMYYMHIYMCLCVFLLIHRPIYDTITYHILCPAFSHSIFFLNFFLFCMSFGATTSRDETCEDTLEMTKTFLSQSLNVGAENNVSAGGAESNGTTGW